VKGTRHSEEQIMTILKQGEAGLTTTELCRQHGITEQTYYRWKTKPTAPAQLFAVLVADSICTYTSGDTGMRKASTWMLEKRTQTPSPSPDHIPAEDDNKTLTGNSHANWYIERGHLNCVFARCPASYPPPGTLP